MIEKKSELPFIYLKESVKEAFNYFDIMNIKGSEYLEGQVDFKGRYFVSMVGFVGELTGLISIYCSRQIATHIAAKMLGVEVQVVNSDVRDAIGEIVNIIVGMFKSKFGTAHSPFLQSTSSVIDGDNFSSNKYDLNNNRLIVCEGDEGKIYVQLLIKR